jgi:hypothetical protein
MTLKRAFIPVVLAGGLFLLVSAAAAEDIQHSIDQGGTIHIRNTDPASQKKPGAVSPSKPVASAQMPPSYGRRSRRPRGLDGKLSPLPQNFGEYYKSSSKPSRSKGEVAPVPLVKPPAS